MGSCFICGAKNPAFCPHVTFPKPTPRDERGRFVSPDPEIRALRSMHRSLSTLDDAPRGRVIRWAWSRFVEDKA